MTRSPVTWARAVRAVVVAGVLLLVLTFVAANFVLVDVRLWGLSVETRLAWAAVVPAVVGFAAGMLFCRTRGAARARESARTRAVGSSSGETPPERHAPGP